MEKQRIDIFTCPESIVKPKTQITEVVLPTKDIGLTATFLAESLKQKSPVVVIAGCEDEVDLIYQITYSFLGDATPEKIKNKKEVDHFLVSFLGQSLEDRRKKVGELYDVPGSPTKSLNLEAVAGFSDLPPTVQTEIRSIMANRFALDRYYLKYDSKALKEMIPILKETFAQTPLPNKRTVIFSLGNADSFFTPGKEFRECLGNIIPELSDINFIFLDTNQQRKQNMDWGLQDFTTEVDSSQIYGYHHKTEMQKELASTISNPDLSSEVKSLLPKLSVVRWFSVEEIKIIYDFSLEKAQEIYTELTTLEKKVKFLTVHKFGLAIDPFIREELLTDYQNRKPEEYQSVQQKVFDHYALKSGF